jgi:hypothetical protein
MKIHTCLLLTAVVIVSQVPVFGAQLDMARQALTSLDETSLDGNMAFKNLIGLTLGVRF